jgi:hypothetical protein
MAHSIDFKPVQSFDAVLKRTKSVGKKKLFKNIDFYK